MAFVRGWDLSLVVLAAIPALVIAGGVCGVFTARLQARPSHCCCHCCVVLLGRGAARIELLITQPTSTATRLQLQERASRAYSRAGAIAGEALSGIRTVAAYGREEASLRAYAAALAAPMKVQCGGGLRGLGFCRREIVLVGQALLQLHTFSLHTRLACLPPACRWGSGRACWRASPWAPPTSSSLAPMPLRCGMAPGGWRPGSWMAARWVGPWPFAAC